MRGLAVFVLVFAAPAAQLPLRWYTTADGLADNGVVRIVSDARGYMWFATMGGLSRFDGYTFSNQTKATGLPGAGVYDIAIDGHGNYWLAAGKGLVRFRPEKPVGNAERMVVYGQEVGGIGAVLVDHNGRVWCGTEKGLFAMDPAAGKAARLKEVDIGLSGTIFGYRTVNVMAEDREGAIWIGTRSGAIYRRLPDGRVERYNALEREHAEITDLLFDRAGRLWIGTERGLYRAKAPFHPGSTVFEALHWRGGVPDTRMFALFQSRDGDIWVGMYQYLAQFSADGAFIRLWGKEDGIPGRGPLAIGQDQDGNLWLGTDDLGVVKLAAGGFLTYSGEEIASGVVNDIAETASGEVYISGHPESGGLLLSFLKDDHFQPVRPKLPPSVKEHAFGWRPARIVCQDHSGEWWLASFSGLIRYPAVERVAQLERTPPRAIYTTRDGLPTNWILRLYEDRRGRLWIGPDAPGAVYLDGSRSNFQKLQPAGMGHAAAFGEDASGNIWIGDDEGALWRVRDGQAALIAGVAGRGWINAFLADHAGRLWVATEGKGLMRFDHPEAARPDFREYGLREGLSSLATFSLAEDGDGSIYVATRHGVDQLEPNLTHFRHYTPADGIAPGTVNAAYRARNGYLWFGTNHGVTRYQSGTRARTHAPAVWITGLSVGGRPEAVSEMGEAKIDRIDVPAGREHIQFDFVGLSFAPGDGLRYQYRMGDGEWSEPIASRSVHYGSLAAGKYQFSVRAINSDGQTSEQPAEVDFRVIPPLWQRAWFEALLTAVAMAGAVWVHRARVRRLVEIERVRTRIATDLHDDIGSSLSQIAVLSEVARQRAARGEGSEPIERIGTLSREMLDSIGDIVWTIQPRKDHLSDLRKRMRRFATDVLSARNVELHWAAEEEHDQELGTELRRQVYLIFKEAIHNMARHSSATEAWVRLEAPARWLELEVRDNGRGIDRTDEDGNGLRNMKLRAARVRGQLRVLSEDGRGTTVTLRAPLGSYLNRW